MEARTTKRPRDKKNAQSSSKKSKSTNDTGPMHPHQTWPCSGPMMDAYGNKEQLLAMQREQRVSIEVGDWRHRRQHVRGFVERREASGLEPGVPVVEVEGMGVNAGRAQCGGPVSGAAAPAHMPCARRAG